MTHYVLNLVYEDPNLIPGPNSEVGRKLREVGLKFSGGMEATAEASMYSKLSPVARVVVTQVQETHVATYRKGRRS